MKKYLIMLMLGALVCGMQSCGDDDDDDSNNEQNNTECGLSKAGSVYTLKRKTNYGNDWIYVNLSKMDTVAVSEDGHYNSTDWDIAFNRYNVRTNSGKSGIGQGGVYKTSKTSFNGVSAADIPSDDAFTVDSTAEITASLNISANFEVTTVESSYNYVLADCLVFAPSSSGPTYTPSDYIYIIKGADGSYYKFKAVSFYDEEGNSGYYSFGCEKLK